MWRDKGIVVSRKEEHVAILHVDISLLYIDGYCQIDEREIPDENVVLQVEGP